MLMLIFQSATELFLLMTQILLGTSPKIPFKTIAYNPHRNLKNCSDHNNVLYLAFHKLSDTDESEILQLVQTSPL